MNREELKKAARPRKTVIIPEWGGIEITIQKMEAGAVMSSPDPEDQSNGHAREARRKGLAREAIYSIIDPDTDKLMYADTPEDIEEVLSFSFDGLRRLNREIVDFNNLRPEVVEKNS